MQFDTQDMISRLGIGELSETEQADILDEANRRIGENLSSGLNEQQINEYQAIIDGNQAVIDAWLEQNVPDYKESPIYQEIDAGFATDPDQVPADKAFAAMAWVQQHTPDALETIEKVLTDYGNELKAAHV